MDLRKKKRNGVIHDVLEFSKEDYDLEEGEERGEGVQVMETEEEEEREEERENENEDKFTAYKLKEIRMAKLFECGKSFQEHQQHTKYYVVYNNGSCKESAFAAALCAPQVTHVKLQSKPVTDRDMQRLLRTTTMGSPHILIILGANGWTEHQFNRLRDVFRLIYVINWHEEPRAMLPYEANHAGPSPLQNILPNNLYNRMDAFHSIDLPIGPTDKCHQLLDELIQVNRWREKIHRAASLLQPNTVRALKRKKPVGVRLLQGLQNLFRKRKERIAAGPPRKLQDNETAFTIMSRILNDPTIDVGTMDDWLLKEANELSSLPTTVAASAPASSSSSTSRARLRACEVAATDTTLLIHVCSSPTEEEHTKTEPVALPPPPPLPPPSPPQTMQVKTERVEKRKSDETIPVGNDKPKRKKRKSQETATSSSNNNNNNNHHQVHQLSEERASAYYRRKLREMEEKCDRLERALARHERRRSPSPPPFAFQPDPIPAARFPVFEPIFAPREPLRRRRFDEAGPEQQPPGYGQLPMRYHDPIFMPHIPPDGYGHPSLGFGMRLPLREPPRFCNPLQEQHHWLEEERESRRRSDRGEHRQQRSLSPARNYGRRRR
jgi:hypothetical protein